MANIVIGEKVINKMWKTGTIVSKDDKYIYVDYQERVGTLPLDAFEQGSIKYVNADLQSPINEHLAKVKSEQDRKAEEKRIIAEKLKSEQKLAVEQSFQTGLSVKFSLVKHRLDPAPISFSSVRKKDKELIQEIFNECDKDTIELYASFKPRMEYPKYTSYSRSKYCVGFLTKYMNTYVLRLFSRNDIYKKTINNGVEVMKSDTTELFRVLCVNDKVYQFSKNLSYSDGYYNHSASYNKWHVSELGVGILLNEVIRKCDCEYLNDYIAEKKIEFSQYINLLFPALYSNKAEIIFKHKLFLSAYRIPNIINYVEDFSSKQIDFASKNNVINTLPIIKRYGVYDLNILQDLEAIMKKRRYGNSTYDILEQTFERLNFERSDLGKRLIDFVKKVDRFDAALYHDYVCELSRQQGVTIRDYFDKDYIDRHDMMVLENAIYYDKEQNEKYILVAKELSWIDREENGYFIIIPKTISEFKNEGRMQHNCVYTSEYYQMVINHQSIIVFLREKRDVSYVTIEYDYETFDVLQAYGKYNARIDKNLYKYVVDLGKKLKYEMLSQQ